MKLFKILIPIFVLFLLSFISFNSYGGWFDKTICVETDAQNRNGIYYLPNKSKPFTGNNLCKYENGQFKSQGEIKDGKKYGEWTEWFENGLTDTKKFYEIDELPISLFDISLFESIDENLIQDINSYRTDLETYFIFKDSIKYNEKLKYYFVTLDKSKLVNEIIGIKYYETNDIDTCFKEKKDLIKFVSDYYKFDQKIFTQKYYKASSFSDNNKTYVKDSSIVNYIKNNKELIIDVFCEYHPFFQDNALIQGSYPFRGSVGIILTTSSFYIENHMILPIHVLKELDFDEFQNQLKEYEEDTSDGTEDILNSLPKLDNSAKINDDVPEYKNKTSKDNVSSDLTDEDLDRIEFIMSFLLEIEAKSDLICAQKVYLNSTIDERKKIYDMLKVLEFLIKNNIPNKPENIKYFNEVGLSESEVGRLNEKFYNCF